MKLNEELGDSFTAKNMGAAGGGANSVSVNENSESQQ
jgi:hypothetical protein